MESILVIIRAYGQNFGVSTKRTSSSALDRVPAVRRGKVRCNSSSLKGNKPRNWSDPRHIGAELFDTDFDGN